MASAGFVKMKNPYTFGIPVRGEGKFFGRERELGLIFDTLESVPRGQKQDMVVLGPRRIGKSSLLYRLVDLLTINEDFVPVYVDVQNIKPRKNYTLFVKILQEIVKGLKQGHPHIDLPHPETLGSDSIPEDLEFLTFNEDMRRLNELIEAKHLPRLVLMFDEVELLVEFGGRDMLDWFRSLIQSMVFSVFVVAGSEQLYALTQDYGSPFYNIFKTVTLHPLTTQEARNLLLIPAANIGLQISTDGVEKILRYTGNNPYFINGITHYLVQRLNSQNRRQALSQDVDHVLQNCIENFSSQLAYLWGKTFPVEKVILYALAKSGSPQTIDGLIHALPPSEISDTLIRSDQDRQDIFDGLVQQQIIRRANGDRYWFLTLLFADWILAKVDDDEVIKYASVPEAIKVSFDTAAIRQLLTAAFSDEELTTLAFDHFRPVYEQLSSSMSKGQKIQQLIDYSYRHEQLETLLARVGEKNPAQYARFEPSLRR